MLDDFFGIRISSDSEQLTGLPILTEVLKPFEQDLPMFVLRLALVNYAEEGKYLHQVAEELSYFYARYIEVLQSQPETSKAVATFKFDLEHKLLPQMKRSFAVRKRMAVNDDMTFSMVTCTENLYKVFERC